MEVKNNTSAFMDTPSVTSEVYTSASGTLPGKYHQDELTMHSRINNTAIGIIIAGFATIIIAFVYMVKTGNTNIGIITTIAGVVSEFISSLLFRYVTKASDDKWKYFATLGEDEEEKRLLRVINSSPNPKFQEKMIEKLVNTYCENRKKR